MQALGWILSILGLVLACFVLWVTWIREDEFTMAYRRGEALDVLAEIWHREHDDADDH